MDQDKVDQDNRLSFILEELNRLQRQADRDRVKYRARAFLYKILAVALAAAITVFLGIKAGGVIAEMLQNIALGCGAAIGVLNAIEAFFDYRFLWMRETMFAAKLEVLKRDVHLYACQPKQGAEHEHNIKEFQSCLKLLMEDYMQDWLKLRQRQLSEKAEGRLFLDTRNTTNPRRKWLNSSDKKKRRTRPRRSMGNAMQKNKRLAWENPVGK